MFDKILRHIVKTGKTHERLKPFLLSVLIAFWCGVTLADWIVKQPVRIWQAAGLLRAAPGFRPSHRPAFRAAAAVLAVCIMVTMMPSSAFAAGTETGLCEHHPVHDEKCGYSEARPAGSCEHEHTEDCYTGGLICGFGGDEDAAVSGGTEHIHSRDCYALDCPHDRGGHTSDCGYTEEKEGTPCGYVCELCGGPDGPGNQDGEGDEYIGNENENGSIEKENNENADNLNETERIILAAFDEWDGAAGYLSVPAGTPQEELALPDTLSAMAQRDDGSEPVIIQGVVWEPDVPYEGEEGSYVFTASAAGYVCAGDVNWPAVTVTVEEPSDPELSDPEPDEIDAFCAAIDVLPDVDSLFAAAPGDADPEYPVWVAETRSMLAGVEELWKEFQALPESARETVGESRIARLQALFSLFGRLKEAETWNSVHRHCICGGSVNAGDHTSHSDVDWTAWTDTSSLPGTAGNYYLTGDVVLGGTWEVPAGTTGLCLNGHSVSVKSGVTSNVITISAGNKLELCDCNGSNGEHTVINPASGAAEQITGGVITGGVHEEYAGGICLEDGFLRMYGGTVAGNENTACNGPRDNNCGGGVSVFSGGTFYLYGGAVRYNYSGRTSGGGVGVMEQGSFTMYGGSVSENRSDKHGGGVIFKGGKGFINGGGINENRSSGSGGGVCIDQYQSGSIGPRVILDGVSIKGNTCGGNGGGIWNGTTRSSVTLSGAVQITGNKKGMAVNNLFLGRSTPKLKVSGLANNAEVGITSEGTPGVNNPVTVTEAAGADYSRNFKSDNAGFSVQNGPGNAVQLAVIFIPSNDAALSALSYTADGGKPADIPGFDADTLSYNVSLPYDTDGAAVIKLTGTVNHKGASITENKGVVLSNGSGTAVIRVTAENGTTIRTYSVNFTTAADPRSGAKQITAFTIPNQVGNTVIDQENHTITVTMPGGTNVTGLSPAVTVSEKASVSPQSGAAQNFTDPVLYTVTAENKTTQTYTASVTVLPIAPTVTTESLPDGIEGTQYSQTLQADGDAPFTWSIADGSLPAGLALNNGVISGTPDTGTVGTYPFTVRAENKGGSSDRQLTIRIKKPKPTVTSVTVTPKTAEVKKGGTRQFSAAVIGTNGPAQTVSWSIEGSHATDTTISETGLLSVSINETQTALTIEATSTVDTGKSGTASVTVLPIAPTVTTESLPDGIEGTQYSQTLQADGDAPFTWSIADGSLPAGLALNSGVISGTPDTGTAGTYPFTVRAENKGGSSDRQLTIKIKKPKPTVTSVTVTSDEAEVKKGGIRQFSAAVIGTNGPAQTVSWSIEGEHAAETTISETGLLSVSINETQTALTIEATSTVDTGKSGTASVTVKEPLYVLTVNGGFGSGSYIRGEQVTVTAENQENKRFKEWTAAGVVLNNVSENSVTFSMPANTVTLTAVYEDLYTVTVDGSGNGTAAADTEKAAAGDTVNISASADSGYRFMEWQVISGSVSLADAKAAATSFTMPAENVTVQAKWIRNSSGGDSGNRDNGNHDNGNRGNENSNGPVHGVVPPAAVIPPEAAPDAAQIEIEAQSDGSGGAEVTLSESAVEEAIRRIQEETKRNGTRNNGVTVRINVPAGGREVNSLTVNLPKVTQEQIIRNEVQTFALILERPDISLGLNLESIREINRQADADVQITATRLTDTVTLSGEAGALVGGRPLFQLTAVSKDGTKAITDFGGGSVALIIPYKLQPGESGSGLCLIYIDEQGNPRPLMNSGYDAGREVLQGVTSHFSLYAVGYQAPAVFRDIADHWAKKEIEFAAARGLMSGGEGGRFRPDEPMTRAMLATALGRLAGLGPEDCGAGSFTDVPEGAYYAPYAAWAEKTGVMKNAGGGLFAPDRAVSRQELAVIMADYAEVMGRNLSCEREPVFFEDDADIASGAAGAVKAMQQAGVLMGKDGNRFDPQGKVTRAQAAAALHRYSKLAVNRQAAQGLDVNDSGSVMLYENGRPVRSDFRTVGTITYSFNSFGEAVLPAKKQGHYVVRRGDSFWRISRKFNCTMEDLERLNGKSRYDVIRPGDVLIIPEA